METPNTEIREILQRAHAGDRAALGQLVHRYRDMAFGYAMTLLSDEPSAEDAVQDALLIAYQNFERLRRPDSFEAWLRGIVRHRCHRARRAKARIVGLDRIEEVAAPALREPREDLVAALAALPPDLREVLMLGCEGGLTQREIASRLGLSASTVNMRLHAA